MSDKTKNNFIQAAIYGIIAIAIFAFLWVMMKPTEYYIPNKYNCYYCGKIIRNEGKNIHCTVIQYNENSIYVTCDYCGKSNSIREKDN